MTHIPESTYVFLLESWIFSCLTLGTLVADGLPVLPLVIFVGLAVCLLSMTLAMVAIRVGFVRNFNFPLGDAPSIVLSLLQVGFEHAFGLCANFAISFLAVFVFYESTPHTVKIGGWRLGRKASGFEFF